MSSCRAFSTTAELQSTPHKHHDFCKPGVLQCLRRNTRYLGAVSEELTLLLHAHYRAKAHPVTVSAMGCGLMGQDIR